MRFSEQELETGSVRQTPNICILNKQKKKSLSKQGVRPSGRVVIRLLALSMLPRVVKLDRSSISSFFSHEMFESKAEWSTLWCATLGFPLSFTYTYKTRPIGGLARTNALVNFAEAAGM
jgi:hypothetical protein